ncbi:uncharacterized protein C5L36_0A12710 [Pichia kudriavzevii]|uniref:malate dehydrogenase n=1 Tax=Pichia kudriavzevii TaxID=4909 RepID=A0A099P797_PICKU|nr:uncharacterized protein C5L36_0A12710 [Pichia kudriavzevii]AWU74695.1 hypothetical protein C5L36_0A12710 [Pichia kudriavzevii]KGK40800.1 hypothetical protein JL09_g238 [Pichia kudriavzevii]ONH72099.1 Malate dehydrogenase, cytoplasmic [Pichia kudriavzevii]
MSNVKVALLGAAGGIGQPLALLLKLNPNITHLALYDVVHVPGVAADLHHIDTDVVITHHLKDEDGTALANALKDATFVIVPAGVPRKPGMTRGDLFTINAGICAELANAISLNAPNAFTLVITNPVNSTVPIFKEIFAKNEAFNPRRLFGVTALDHVRSNTFLSELIDGKNPQHFDVTVVGGHSGNSIVPLFSLVKAAENLDDEIIDALIHRVQYGGDEVVEAKSGAGSATLSMAYAANKFFNILLNGYLGLKKTMISSYVFLDDSINGVPQLKENLSKLLKGSEVELPTYLAVPMTYGKEGIEQVFYDWVFEMSPKEKENFITAIEYIDQNIEKGLNFMVR